MIQGIRTSSALRTWCELSGILSLEDLVAVGDFIIHWANPLASHTEMVDFARNFPGPRGRNRRRAALPLLHERSESRRESILRILFVRAQLPGLEVNFPIRTSGGFRYRADLAIPRVKVVVEYQSAFHESPERFRSDMTRKSRLTTDGWTVVEVNSDDLLRPRELLARLNYLLRTRERFDR
jgi:very-short-patch-repair endonuclease